MPTKKKPPQPRRRLAIGDAAVSADLRETVDIARGIQLSANGLIVGGNPTMDQWERALDALGVSEKGVQFAIGDLLIRTERQFGEEAAQLLDATKWKLATLEGYRWVASRISPEDRRMGRLGIKHHQHVAPLPKVKQRLWLSRAAADNEPEPWTAARLKKAIIEGEDLPISAWFVIVACPNGQVQDELMARLDAEGLKCKASSRRQRKAQEPEAA